MNAKVSATVAARKSHVTPKAEGWRDYSSGVAWGTVLLFFGVLIGYTAMLVALYMGALSLVGGMFAATLFIYLGFTVVHEAGHGNIAHEVSWMKPFERILGWVSTLLFLVMPFGLFAKIHDYHHAFTNDPDRDPDHWVSGDTWWEASLRAPTLAFNYLYLTVTRFKDDPVITQTHRSSLAYYLVTLSIVLGLLGSGLWFELLIVGILPIFLASYVLGMLFDWIPHMPTRQQSRYQNTRSYLFPGLGLLTMGQSYHHIHHLYPRVTWYHYKRVFDLTRPELEAKNAPIEALFSNNAPGFGRSPYALEPSSLDGFHKLTLRVESIQQVTTESVAISFESLNGKTLPFKAGQYVTLSKLIKGEVVTRCYSICVAPGSGKLTVAVKRVENGRLSVYLNDTLRVGDELTVAGPFGDYVFDPAHNKATNMLTLIAGGSGITPNLAIAKTALTQCSDVQVHLIYANRSIKDMMFLFQLNQLLFDYSDRFNVTNIFEKPHASWHGEIGYLTEETLLRVLKSQAAPLESAFYVCGPTPMKDAVIKTLRGIGVKENQVLVEAFTQAAHEPDGEVYSVQVELANGLTHSLTVAENQTVLQAAQQKGVKIPHACGVGQCGCCMMLIAEGECELAVDDAPGLLFGEREQGLTLACQCRPKSSLVLKEANTI